MEVTCEHCGKAFRVADRLAGKKAQCKNCGQLFTLRSAPSADDTRHPHAASPTPSTDDADSGAAEEESPIGVMEDEPESTSHRPVFGSKPSPPAAPPVTTTHASCPSCGSPLAPDALLCLTCGYNRQQGSIVRTEVATPLLVPGQRIGPINPDQRDYRGFRPNVPYINGSLDWCDHWIPTISLYGSLIYLAIDLIRFFIYLAMFPVKISALEVILIIPIILVFLLFVVVILLFANFGVTIAGWILKFDMPDNPMRRAYACGVGAMLVTYSVVLVALVAAAVGLQTTAASLEGSPNHATMVLRLMGGFMAAMLAIWIVAVGSWSISLFPLVRFFYRLKTGEAALATLFFSLFSIVGFVAFFAAFFGIVYLCTYCP